MEQYELRELHFLSLMRTKECEIQLSQARAEDHRKRAEAEATKSRQLSSQVSTFTQTESELRSQLNIYVEKFKQVGSVFFYYRPTILLVLVRNDVILRPMSVLPNQLPYSLVYIFA